jgi:probable HAF family extracellular repeat protein
MRGSVLSYSLLVVATSALIGWSASPAAADVPYQAVPISDFTTGVCPGQAVAHGSAANAVNNAGHVVGWAAYFCDDGSLRGFVFDAHDGLFERLPLLGGYLSAGVGINDVGQIAMTATTQPGFGFGLTQPRAVVDSTGNLNNLGVLPPCSFCAPFSPGSFARAIDARGDVAGYSATFDGTGWVHAFLFDGQKLNDLGTLGGLASRGYGLNDHGEVVGASTSANSTSSHAFLYSGGVMRDLGTLGGATSAAYAVNDPGVIVGVSDRLDGTQHAFIDVNGGMHDLGTLGGANSVARGINRWGQVVGASQTASGEWHAFLFSGGAMIDLNSITGGITGTLAEANGINDYGRIAGAYAPGAAAASAWPIEAWPFPGVLPNLNFGFGFDARSRDTAPPTCVFRSSGTLPSGQSFVRYTIGDSGSGLAQVAFAGAANALLDYSFDPGATNPQVVTVIRQHMVFPWSFTVRVRDIAGNTIECPL